MLWVGRRWNGYRLALKVPDVPWNHHPKFKVKDKNNFNHHPYYFLFRLFCVHMVAACSSWNFQWFVVILVITCVICILSSWTITAPVSFFFFFLSLSLSLSLLFIYFFTIIWLGMKLPPMLCHDHMQHAPPGSRNDPLTAAICKARQQNGCALAGKK